MSRPRVFVSSTFYDLKQIRSDLEHFIREMGYDPVLHERGSVPYGPKEKLEEYCYREIHNVELMVSIIGSRFGSQSDHKPYSVSQQELKTAYELGIQVFIFVESAVLGEYQTYLKNKDLPGVVFNYVDDVKVYRFLQEVYALPNNNTITAFGSAQDITVFLREQWAGMFQRFLQTQGRQQEAQMIRDLQSNIQTLNQLVTYLTKEKQNSDGAIREILRSNHPIFSQLQRLLLVGYRVYFTNRAEFSQWVKVARQYEMVSKEKWEDPDYAEWTRTEDRDNSYKLLKLWNGVFDDNGELHIFTAQQWQANWVLLSTHERPSVDFDPGDDIGRIGISDDDIPF